jgi:hypothetical protein
MSVAAITTTLVLIGAAQERRKSSEPTRAARILQVQIIEQPIAPALQYSKIG